MVGRGAIALAPLLELVLDTSGLPGTFSKMQPVKPREFGLLVSPPACAALPTATSHVMGVVGSVPAREPREYMVPILGDGVPKALVISKC